MVELSPTTPYVPAMLSAYSKIEEMIAPLAPDTSKYGAVPVVPAPPVYPGRETRPPKRLLMPLSRMIAAAPRELSIWPAAEKSMLLLSVPQ